MCIEAGTVLQPFETCKAGTLYQLLRKRKLSPKGKIAYSFLRSPELLGRGQLWTWIPLLRHTTIHLVLSTNDPKIHLLQEDTTSYKCKSKPRKKNLWWRSNVRLSDTLFPPPFWFIALLAFLGLFLLSETSISLCSTLLLSILNRGIEFTKCTLKSTNALQTEAVLELYHCYEFFSCYS